MDKSKELKNAALEVASSVQQGVPPSNKDIGQVIDKTKASLEQQRQKGNLPDIIEKLEKVLDDTQLFLKDKNSDEKIQKFIIHTKEMVKEMTPSSADLNLSDEEKKRLEAVQKKTKNAALNLQHAAIQIITSPDFRQLLWDIADLLKQMGQEEIERNDPGVKESAEKVKNLSLQDRGSIEAGKNIASETKDKAQQLAKGVASDIKEGKLEVSEEKKESLMDKWNQILRKVENNQDFQRAINALFGLYDELCGVCNDAKSKAQKTKEEWKHDENLQKLRQEGRAIVAEFVGKNRLDQFVDHFWALYDQVANDRELNKFLDDLRAHVTDVINNPGQLDKEEVRKRGDEMMKKGEKLWKKFKGRSEASKLFQESQDLLNAIKSDAVTAKLRGDAEDLAKSTILDKSGRPSFQMTKETLQSMKSVIVPAILENLKNIPIGRIEGVTDNYNFVLDNLSFSGKDLLPEHVYIKLDADIDFDFEHMSTQDTPQYLLRVEFRGMDAILNNTQFWFEKKSFPSMEDHGIADVRITGTTIVLKFVSPREGPSANKFALKNAKCHIYSADVDIKKAQHDIILPMLTKMYAGTVRHRLEKIIERNLNETMGFVSHKLNGLMDSAQNQMQQQYEKVLESTVQPLLTQTGLSAK